MAFRRGQVSYGRFVIGGASSSGASDGGGSGVLSKEHLESLGEHTLRPSTIGAPPEYEAGWCAGEHVFDEFFDEYKNLLDGGLAMQFGLRIDTNRVPSDIKQAIKSQQISAAQKTSPTGAISGREKRELREVIDRELQEELSSGKHRSSKMSELLWDSTRSVIYSASNANKTSEFLGVLWRETFNEALTPDSGGLIAYRSMLASGVGGRFDELEPSAFTKPPTGLSGEVDASAPEVPWRALGLDMQDFLANEWLIWLWHACETRGGEFEVRPAGAPTTVSVAFDRTLEMECCWGITGKQTLKSDAEGIAPIRMPESRTALACGKWPRRVGLIFAEDALQWTFTFQADRWLVTGCALPKPPEPLATPEEQTLDRLINVRRLDELLIALYDVFLLERADKERWPKRRHEIREWIMGRSDSDNATQRPSSMIEVQPPAEVEAPSDAAGSELRLTE